MISLIGIPFLIWSGSEFFGNSGGQNIANETLKTIIPENKLEENLVGEKEKVKPDTFKDSRDGQTYKWVRLKDGKKWMTQNLNYKTKDSWCYDEKNSNCDKYGRLYTWQAAKKACPSGWRLPSDDEWRKMTKYYGGADEDVNDGGKAAYKNLIQGGTSGFSALLGGYCGPFLGLFHDLDGIGRYWSSTEKSSSGVWYYDFSSDGEYFSRNFHGKTVGFSCRCLQD